MPLNPELLDHMERTLKRMPKEEMIRFTIRAIEGFYTLLDEEANKHGGGEAKAAFGGRRASDNVA